MFAQSSRRTSQLSEQSQRRQSQPQDSSQIGGSIIRKLVAFSRSRESKKSVDTSERLPGSPPTNSPPLPPITSRPLPPLPSESVKASRVDSVLSSSPTALSKTAGQISQTEFPPRRPPRPISGLLFECENPGLARKPNRPGRIASDGSQNSDASTASSRLWHAGLRAESSARAPKRPPMLQKLCKASEGSKRRTSSSESAADRDRVPTPSRIVETATELYSVSSTLPMMKVVHDNIIESILSTPSVSRPFKKGEEVKTPSPVMATKRATLRKSRLSRTSTQSTSPTGTQIHLRGGSVITLTPPELDPWHRSTYLPGPIRLLKPFTMPRKNSVATLEHFQDAVDKIFEDGQSITKRKSELAVANEICTFFMEFALSDCRYTGDVLAVEGAEDSDESDEEMSFQCMGQDFQTLPDSPTAWRTPLRPEFSMPMLPPVENEETLRVKGIGWLARQRHRPRRPSNYLPMVSEPEESMLDSVLAASVDADNIPVARSRDPDVLWQDVAETNGAAPWIKSLGGEKVAAAFWRRSQ